VLTRARSPGSCISSHGTENKTCRPAADDRRGLPAFVVRPLGEAQARYLACLLRGIGRKLLGAPSPTDRNSLSMAARCATAAVSCGHQASDTLQGLTSRTGTKRDAWAPIPPPDELGCDAHADAAGHQMQLGVQRRGLGHEVRRVRPERGQDPVVAPRTR